LAVEEVTGELCSTKLPESSEFTGNFLFFSTLSYPDTSGKPFSDAVSTRLLIRCNEKEQGITGKSREFTVNCLQLVDLLRNLSRK